MKLGILFLDIFPPSVAFSSHFLHSALRWTTAKQAPAQYSRTSSLPAPFLYPSNSTSTFLFSNSSVWVEVTRWKIKSLHLSGSYDTPGTEPLYLIKSLMQQMSSMFHTKENWVSKKPWSPGTIKEPGFEAKHCGASCCIVRLILRRAYVLDWGMEEFSHWLSGHLILNLWAFDFLSLVLD